MAPPSNKEPLRFSAVVQKDVGKLTFALEVHSVGFAALCWCVSWFAFTIVAAWVVYAVCVFPTCVQTWVLTFIHAWKLFNVIIISEFYPNIISFKKSLHSKLNPCVDIPKTTRTSEKIWRRRVWTNKFFANTKRYGKNSLLWEKPSWIKKIDAWQNGLKIFDLVGKVRQLAGLTSRRI